MVKSHGIPESNSIYCQEISTLKQICEKYNNDDDTVSYSIEFNSTLEKANGLNIADQPGLAEDLAYINKTLGNMCYDEKDFEQALIHYSDAANYYAKLDLKSDLAETIQGVSDAHFMLDQYAKVLEYNPIVLKYYKENDEESKAADSNYYIAESHYQLDDYERAAEYALQALSYYEKVKDTSSMADTYRQLARIYFYDDNYTDAIIFFKKSASMHQALDQMKDLTSDYLELGDAFYFDDQDENAKSAYLVALTILEENYDLDHLRTAYNNLLKTCFQLDEYEDAIEFGSKALNLYGEEEAQHDLINIYAKLGDSYYYQEDYSKAISSYSEAEWRCSIYFEDVEDIRKKGELNENMFWCCYKMGEFDEAIKFLNEAIEINKENKFLIELAVNFRDLALCIFRGKNDPKAAYEKCNRALEILNREDDLETRGKVYELMGDIQFDFKFHHGTDYYPEPGKFDEVLRKLKTLQGGENVDMKVIALKSRIRSQSISAYSKALQCYQEAGEEEKEEIVMQKINLVKEKL